MTGLWALIKRNTKLYFKDKGMFISSLITPMILLVLYATFLGNGLSTTRSVSAIWRPRALRLPTRC